MVMKHFSLADWDYDVPGPYISDEQYVSAPSSLAAKYTTSPAFNRQGWAMCNLLSALCIPDGRIVNYIWLAPLLSWKQHFCYRVQANPTAPATLPADCYWVSFHYDGCVLKRRVAAADTTLASYSPEPNWPIHTWLQFRLTWWQYLQPDMTKLLRHTVEQYKDGAWVELFHYDDSVNRWATSATNKVGFVLLHRNQVNEPIFMDNTEIWKRLT